MAKLIWDYVREACIQCNITGPGDSLEYTPAHTEGRPVIHADDSNRVLLFPGAFNPPHQGHVQLLKSVLSDVTRHLNIRGVIIFPQDDEQVREKTKHEPVDLDLTKSKRSALWRSAEEFPEKDAWVFEGSRSSLRKLQNQLQRNLKGEHINLTYLLLVGPDWLSTRAVYDPGKWNCDEAITSDISRPVDFRCEYTLRQIPGCFAWFQRIFGGATACFPWDSSSQMICGSHLIGGVSLWSTSTFSWPYRQYYLVPCSRQSSPDTCHPSSTQIRQRIFNACIEQRPVDDTLFATALSPGLLLGYIREIVLSDGEGEVISEEEVQ